MKLNRRIRTICKSAARLVVYSALGVCLGATALRAQDAPKADSAQTVKKERPSREKILKMKVEDLLELSLDELNELLEIAGVTSLEDLINLIVSTASKSDESMQDAGAVIYVITSKEIERFGALSLFEIIDRLCNTYTLGTYLYPNNIVSIRGNNTPNNTNTLLLLDGRPMRESYANGYSASIYNAFPLDRIDRIEIVRGPGSVLYGTCALTGVINIITKNADSQGPLNAKLRYGSFSTLEGSMSGAKRFGDLEITGGVNYLTNKGWDYTARGERSYKTVAGQDSLFAPETIKMYQTSLGADLGMRYKGLTFAANYTSTNQASIARNGMWHGNPPGAPGYNNGSNDFHTFIQRGFANLGYETQFSPIWTATFNATYNGFHIDIGNPLMINDLDIYNSNDLLLEWTNFIRPSKELNILIGGLTNTQTGNSRNYYQQLRSGDRPPTGDDSVFYYIPYSNTLATTTQNPSPFPSAPNYNQTWWSAYFQAEYRPIPQLKLIAGGQLNKVTLLDLDFVPRLGAIFHFAESFGVKALYGEAYRSPSVLERNFIGLPVLKANSGIKPERIGTLDVQLFYSTNHSEFYLTYYRSTQTDIITRALPAETIVRINDVVMGIATPINRGSLNSQGVEFEGKYKISQGLSLVGSASWQTTRSFKDDKDTEGTADNLGMPQTMVKVGVNYTAPFGLTVGVFNSYYGKGGSIAAATTKNLNPDAQPYSYLSANVTLNLTELFDTVSIPTTILTLYGTNLLDEAIYYPEFVRRNMNSIPGRAGRAVYAGLTVEF